MTDVLAIPERRIAALTALDKAVGMDKVAVLALHPEFVQSELIDGTRYLDMVDLMNIFAADSRKAGSREKEFNPRRFWNDRKKALLSKDFELSDSIVQLKLPSEDGKMRSTDVAPLWSALLIISFLQTPTSIAFLKAIFKGMESGLTTAEIKYRARNIGKGMEWAADSVHQLMEGDTHEPESAWESAGYR